MTPASAHYQSHCSGDAPLCVRHCLGGFNVRRDCQCQTSNTTCESTLSPSLSASGVACRGRSLQSQYLHPRRTTSVRYHGLRQCHWVGRRCNRLGQPYPVFPCAPFGILRCCRTTSSPLLSAGDTLAVVFNPRSGALQRCGRFNASGTDSPSVTLTIPAHHGVDHQEPQ